MNAIRECKYCGLKAYNEEDLEKFTINKNCSYGREQRCRECANRQKVERARDNKIQAIIDKGGRCYRCGAHYNGRNGAIFQFHHRDPNIKEHSISRLIGRSLKRLEEELEKCDLLCANCHSIEHGGEF